jgi:hypothetical protein
MRAIRIRYFDDCPQWAQFDSVLVTYGIRDSRHFPTAMMCWAIVTLPPEREAHLRALAARYGIEITVLKHVAKED